MDREQRRREKLYRSFKNSLTDGATPSVYDENDLLDIFDYANDVYDEYVQFEVLFLAARLYPESDEIAQRKAYFMYGNLSMPEGAANMARNHRGEGALWDILSLMVEKPDVDESRRRMDEILAKYSEFDDETAIQIVDACSDLEIFDWLVEKKEELKKHCAYPETLIYEMAMEADSKADYLLASKLMEELTEREPFNASFWHLLSQLQVRLDDYENALTSIDYAVAIDADSSAYLLTKAQILYDMKADKEKAKEIVKDLMKKNSDDKMVVHTLAMMYTYEGDVAMAVNTLKDYIYRNPGEKETVEHLLTLGDRNANADVLDIHYRHVLASDEEWASWAQAFFNNDQYVQCADILLTLLHNAHHMPDWSPLIESLYRCGDYTAIAAIYRDYVLTATEETPLDLTLNDALIIVLSLIRCDLSMAAKKLIDVVTRISSLEVYPFEKRAISMFAMERIKAIAKALENGDGFDIDALDPFVDKN